MRKSIVHSLWLKAAHSIMLVFLFPAILFAAQPYGRAHLETQAPDFKLNNLEGREVSFSDFRGRPVILFFWTTSCPYCRGELQALNRMYQKIRQDGVELLALDVGEKPAIVMDFVKRYLLDFPVLLDRDKEVALYKYGVMGVPTYIFIDRQGRVLSSLHSFSHEEYKKIISK